MDLNVSSKKQMDNGEKNPLIDRIFDRGIGGKFNDFGMGPNKGKPVKAFLTNFEDTDALHNDPNYVTNLRSGNENVKKPSEQAQKPFTNEKNPAKKLENGGSENEDEANEKQKKNLQDLKSITGFKTMNQLPPSRGLRYGSVDSMERMKIVKRDNKETTNQFQSDKLNTILDPKLSRPTTTIVSLTKHDTQYINSVTTKPESFLPSESELKMMKKEEKAKGISESENIVPIEEKKKVENFENEDQYMDILNNFIKEAFLGIDHRINFVYYLPSIKENFYDLRPSNFAQINKERVYYTLSAKGFTVYCDKKPREFIKLSEWIIEKQGYNFVSKINFFKNFKIWRIIKIWRKNIHKQKKIAYTKALSDQLLFENKNYNSKICNHKEKCNAIEREKLLDLRVGLESITYKEFENKQKIAREKMKGTLADVHRKCEDIFVNGIKNIFNEVQRDINKQNNEANYNEDDHFGKKKGRKSDKRGKQLSDEQLLNDDNLVGFDNYPYKFKMKIKNECLNFIKLASLFDYIMLDVLRRTYLLSMKEILRRLNELNDVKGPEELNENFLNKREEYVKPPNPNNNRGIPYFLIDCQLLTEKIIPNNYISSSLIQPFIVKMTPDDDFDPTAHLQIDPDEEDEMIRIMGTREPRQETGIINKELPIEVENVIEPHRFFVSFVPSREQLIKSFKNELENSIKELKVPRWRAHRELSKYLHNLENWDDRYADWTNGEQSEDLDPKDILLLSEDPLFKEKDEKIEEAFKKAYSKCENFLQKMNHLFQLHFKQSKINKNLLLDDCLKEPDEMFRLLFHFTEKNVKLLEKWVPFEEEIGMVKLNFEKLRKEILENQNNVVNYLKKEDLPRILKERIKSIRKWIDEMQKNISGSIENENQYLEKTKIKDILSDSFDFYERRLSNIYQIMILLKKKGFEISAEEVKKVESLNISKYALKTSWDALNDNLTRNRDVLKNKLLTQSCHGLNEDARLIELKLTENNKYINYDKDTGKSAIPMYIRDLDHYESQFKVIEKNRHSYNELLKVLGEQDYDFSSVQSVHDKLKVLKNLWNALKNFDIECDEWKKMKFSEIDTEHILNIIDDYYTHGKKAEMQFEESGTAIKELLTNVTNFREIMLVINDLNSEDLTSSHWERIQALFPPEVQKLESKDYPLSDLLSIKAYEHQKIINEIALEAKYHKILKDKMSEVISMRDRISFTIINENDQFRIFDKLDTVVEKIEECQSKLNFVLASRYVRLLKSESDKKDKIDPYSIKSDLDGCLELIEDIKLFQRMWRYLSNIINAHGSTDLKKNVPETNTFEKIDSDWRSQMTKLQDTTPVISYYQKKKNSGQEHILQKHLNEFEKIQLKIEEYLTVLRTRFERFFFISNDDLLYMLSNSSPEKINLLKPYLMKIFEDIAELTISKNDGSQSIPGVFSMGREELVFEENWKQKSVKITETLDEWLSSLEKMMVATLKEKMYLAFQAFSDVIKDEAGHEKWLEKISLTKDNHTSMVNETRNISQVIATVCHIMFCQNTEESIRSIETLAWKAKIDIAIQSYSKMVNKSFALENKTMRKIISNLITHYVHYKDICVNLVKDDVQSTDDFTWQQQLRAYMESSEGGQTPIVKIKQLKSELEYGYEYIGPSSRIVITPLTDRVWLTMTAALKIRLGCSLGGPAGTGKTETTKDLAKFIGIQCIVYNCSEQTDYKLIGNILSGISAHKYGAYACFDEFNRINVEVLSVVATQLFIITQALLTHDTAEPLKKVRILSNCEVNLIGKMGCFITMNPTYSGRTELPDNLKSSFRPITMMVPELAKIAEVRLASEGFGEISSYLALKLSKLYELAPQQLSQQDHYDFTLRSLGTVLTIAGSFKRSQKKLNDETILVNALRDANLPKFLPQDIELFKALLTDLFPKVVVEEQSMANFQNEVKKIIVDDKLDQNEYTLKKCVEIFDILNIKLGVCLTGGAGTGKSTCLNLTSSAITNLKDTNDPRFKDVEKHYLNPKSISMGELFGHENEDTKTFVFGLLTIKIKEVLALDENNKYGWVCLDGPIDTKWIENLNSVLDDSMVFCLSNGERIKLKNHVKIFFEVEDLSKASLATVSRLGVVYFGDDGIGWKPYVRSWVKKHFIDETILTKELKDYLTMIFEDKMEEALDNVNDLYRSGAIFIKPVPVQCVQSTCNFLEVLLTNKNGFIGKSFENLDNIDVLNRIKRKILNVFAFATVWGVFGCVNNKGLHKVESFVKTKFLEIKLENMLFMESHYDFTKNDFVAFSPESSSFNFVKDAPYFSIFVPTLDTVRYSFIFQYLIEAQKNVFITGETGVGKTSILLNTLEKMALTEDYAHIGLNFSAQTSSIDTQKSLESKLEPKKGRRVLGAKSGKKLTIFIDDINMPEPNEWGAHPPIELLRQYLDYGGFWDRTKFFWKTIEDSCLFVCGGPPIGGRSKLTDRFGRHFNLLCLPQPNRQILISIFEAILKGFLSNFSEKVKNTYIETTTATIELFEFVVDRMKPIPAKFHYTFNLRDVSKVVQGLLMSSPTSIKEKETFIKLWTHESSRVFGDRLISEEDLKALQLQIAEIIKSKFKMEKMTYDSLFKQNPLYFGEIHKGDVRDGRPYEEIVSVPNLIKNLEYFQDIFNKDKKSGFKLVFFDYAIVHILRIARVLRQPRGNLVCIGHGGNGKQTLTKFAARTMYCDISTVTKDYRKDLKEIIKNAGSLQKRTMLLLTDTTITSNSLLEDVNNLLNIGEIPNLYPQSDELQAVLNQLAPYMKANGIPETREKYYETFVSQTRENLHIVICTSPVGETLRLRFRKFPALVNCCTLNWFINWPQDALISCCKRAFQNFPYDEKVRETFVNLSTSAHRDLEELTVRYFTELSRKVYVTPKSFLDMIDLLLNLVGQKKDEMDKKISKYRDGVQKLEITHANIQTLEKQLIILEPEITKNEMESQVALKRANVEKEKAESKSYEVREKSAQVAKIQAELRLKTQKVDSKKKEIETNLSETWEEIHNELTADNLLRLQKTTNLGEKRKIILQAAAHLLKGKKLEAQNEILNVLSSEKKRILDFQKEIEEDKVNEGLMKQFQVYYTTHIPKVFDCQGQDPESIKETVLKSQSPPITTIYKWGAGCIYAYEQTKTYLIPTKAEKALLDAEKAEKEKECHKLNEDFSIMQESIQKLTAEQDSIAKTLEDLNKQKFQTTNRKNNAVKLISLLKDEGERWKETVEVLTKEMENFLGNMFLSALSISYLSPFTGVYRKEQVDNWIYSCFNNGVKVNRDFVLENFLSDSVEIRNWNICGLPSDSVSVQNGIMLFNCPKYPLLIDPQLQGNKWLKKLFRNKFNLLKGEMTFKDDSSRNKMINTIALDISKGNSILVENVLEEIDSIFQPLINRNIIIEGSSRYIEFHLANPIEFHPKFKIYFTTKLANPHYPPDYFIKLNIINFTVTFEGLNEQLLGEVFKYEKREKYEYRDSIIEAMGKSNAKLALLSSDILRRISEAKSDTILDDEDLINALQETKKKSDEVKDNVRENSIIEKEINLVRNEYGPVALRGSVLYFVIVDLGMIDSMYQFSLDYFKKVFSYSIKKAKQSDNVKERVAILEKAITEDIYKNTKRGIFESHKTLFSFLIAIYIKRTAKLISEEDWNLFLKGPISFNKEEMPDNPDKSYFSEFAWDTLLFTEIHYQLQGLTKKIAEQFYKFKIFFDNLKNFSDFSQYFSDFPKIMENNFLKLLLIKIFRLDLLPFFIKSYIREELGEYFIDTSPTRLEEIYEDSDEKTPIIFILSQGADPTAAFLEFQSRFVIESEEGPRPQKYINISLGQGQEHEAKHAILEEGVKNGTWIMLQNCHLFTTWMGELAQIVNSLGEDESEEGINKNFRLWLTSMPNKNFPVSILQNSLKMTTEPPSGVKNNIKKIFDQLKDEKLLSNNHPEAFPKLVFSLSLFHSVIQERKKFGPIGFNIRYDFNFADFDTSTKLMKVYLDEYEDIPWPCVEYLVGEVNYGGRVTDDFDRLTMKKTLFKFLTEKLLEREKDENGEEIENGAILRYNFTKSGYYWAPAFKTVSEYNTFIDTLPFSDEPDLFGLHENANIVYQLQESNKIQSLLLNVIPKSSTTGKSYNEIVMQLVSELFIARPEKIELKDQRHKSHDKTFKNNLKHSLTIVMEQEIEKFNRLWQKITDSLTNIKSAIEGTVTMSSEGDEIFNSLLMNRIPLAWTKICYPSHKPLSSWYSDFIQRVEVIRSWVQSGHPPCFWLSGLFFPQGFLTGVLQNHAREHEIPVSDIVFKFHVINKPVSEITKGPPDGVYIHGLFLEAASWDSAQGILVDPKPGEMSFKMPVIHFQTQEKREDEEEDLDDEENEDNENRIQYYNCPAFKTLKRTQIISASGRSDNHVTFVNLPSKKPEDFWVMRGTAIILQLDD